MVAYRGILCSLFLLALTTGIWAQVSSSRMYIFGHSLIDHRPPAIATPNDETTVPYWLNQIADYSGKTYAVGGQYGFLPTHDNLPPAANWGYDGVPGVWDEEMGETFDQADINTIMITAGNFIQYQPAHLPHPIDESTTALASTGVIFDWVDARTNDEIYYIYANWPEMDLPQAYPPTVPAQSIIDEYHDETIGPFMTWWEAYHDSMRVSRPSMDIRLIPVGQIISKILRDEIPGQVPFTELYEDSAPHGRATLYFLAGMITYMAVYEEPVPEMYDPGTIVHPGVRENLIELIDFIWTELNAYEDAEGVNRVFGRDLTTAIEHFELDNSGITLVPNPNNGYFEIRGNLTDYKVEIINRMGQIFDEISSSESGQPTLVDIDSIPNGLYFLRVTAADGSRVFIERLIKSE